MTRTPAPHFPKSSSPSKASLLRPRAACARLASRSAGTCAMPSWRTGNGMELFSELGPSGVEVILTTGYASVESAVEALRAGATDYLVKPINVARLQTVLRRLATTGELKAEIHSLRGELRRYGRFGRLLGGSE